MPEDIVKFYDIDWDTDGEYIASLPCEVELPVDPQADIALEGADWLSDIFGFCVNSFKFECLTPTQ